MSPTAKPKARKASPRTPKVVTVPVDVNRRREWRFDLPLAAVVEGQLLQGRAFKESAKIDNISSTGAHLCLNAPICVGCKLHLTLVIPKEATEGRRVLLRLDGTAIRLQKPDKKGKKQGVAIRFDKEFSFETGGRR